MENLPTSDAKKQFDEALVKFQYECSLIPQPKEVRSKTTGELFYSYTPYEVLVEHTRELRNKYGFSFTVNTELTERNTVKTFLTIAHVGGHSVTSQIELAVDPPSKMMSLKQSIASSITFGLRYVFKNGFGIATSGEDVEQEKEEELLVLSKDRVLKYFKVESVEELTSEQMLTILRRVLK